MTHIPDLVQLSKLETQFHSDPEYTQHVQYVSGSTPRQRSVQKEERWKRQRKLGHGGFGIVWLEQCIQGDSEGKVRAVKEIQKLESSHYYRELEAIALFSHSKYERCFVKSFGWYEDSDSIFITMQYLPWGDLQKYLSSPLPEKEGQHIVSQILEGLHFMHDNGFAHRDLKPANILVVYKGPDWWIKIADFGISKRATEGLTALHTLKGTPAFAAPELHSFIRPRDRSNDSYTNAVDIWSLSVITFLILTGETLFKDQHRLDQYVRGSFKFPSDVLLTNNVSGQGCDFVRRSMAPKPEDRPGVKECLQHLWLKSLIEDAAHETQRKLNISKSSPLPLDYSDAEPSASWSTQDQISVYEIHSSTGVLAERATPAFKEAKSSSATEPVIQPYWKKGRSLRGHSLSVCSVIFSPDGKQIASASRDAVRLWDSGKGAACGILRGHSSTVTGLAYSPDGKQIASASWDETVRLWDSGTGAACGILRGHSSMVKGLAYSPDGKQIASASRDETVRLWDTGTGAACGILRGHSGMVTCLAFSPDGKQIASASRDETVRLWDSGTGAACGIFRGHSDEVLGLAYSPDGKQIASASGDGTVRLWDSGTGAACGILRGHSKSATALAFSPDGKQIASASMDKTVRLWDSGTGAACGILRGHSNTVRALAFSPDGKQIASASLDKTVRLWDSGTGAACGKLKDYSGVVLGLAFSPDGKQIASASGDRTVQLWNKATATEETVKDLTFSKRLKMLFK